MEDEKWLFDTLSEIQKLDRNLIAGLTLLGRASLAYEEHQKYQEEQQRQNKELTAIQQTLEKIQQEQQHQRESIQQERNAWMEERISYEKRLADLEEKVKERGQALQVQATEIETMKLNHAAEEDRLRRESEEALANVKEAYQDIQPELDIYRLYKAWIAENGFRIHLNRLDCSSFATFIACCGKEWIVSYIFQELASVEDLWGWEYEDLAVLDKVIDFCCGLQGLERAKPEGSYNPDYHRKHEEAPAIGTIVDVLLYGVIKDGEILADCQSFVKLSN